MSEESTNRQKTAEPRTKATLLPPPLPPRPSPTKTRATPVTSPELAPANAHDRPTPRSTVIPRMPPPPPLPGMRPRLETLIFHGAPPVAPLTPRPVRAAPPPIPPPRPTRRETEDDHVAFPLVEPTSRDAAPPGMQTSELLPDLSEDDLHEVAEEARDTPPHDTPRAKTDRPPRHGEHGDSQRPWGSRVTSRVRWRGIALAVAGVCLVAWGADFVRDRVEERAQDATPKHATTVAPAAPAPSPAATGCAVAGPARVLARRALVRGGVEATSSERRLGFGVLTGSKEGAAIEVDATSLAVTASTKVVAADPLRRVVPALDGDAPIDAVAESGAAHVVADPDGDARIGAHGGYVTWGGPDEAPLRLWKLSRSGDVEAPRVAPLGASGDRVVAFRHAGGIWVGAFRPGDASPLTPMVRVSDGAAVGAPALDARGDDAIVAWAQRDGRGSPWRVRWVRWRATSGARDVHTLALPPGGPGERAIAPSIAMIDGGRFLLAWTEEGGARHQVRAQLVAADDRPIGEPLAVSAPTAIAGQEQIAIASDGRGAIAFLTARGRRFELVASPIACTMD